MPEGDAIPVVILVESDAAAELMAHARDTLGRFGVPYVQEQIADRAGVATLVGRTDAAGARVYLVVDDAAAGPLSATVAAATSRPVLAVPNPAAGLGPLEALRATTGSGAAVASLAIGKAGAVNAALLAAAVLANGDPVLAERVRAFRAEQTAKVLGDRLD